MSAQASQQPAVGMTASFPTPASSVTGHVAGATSMDDSESTDNKPLGSDAGAASMAPTDPSLRQIEHRPTNHDRPLGGLDTDTGTSVAKAPAYDGAMDIDQDTATTSQHQSSLDSLQKEFSSPFHLCKNCKSFPRLIPLATAIVIHQCTLFPCLLELRFVNTVLYNLQPTMQLVQTRL
jgi:hypothetical protein